MARNFFTQLAKNFLQIWLAAFLLVDNDESTKFLFCMHFPLKRCSVSISLECIYNSRQRLMNSHSNRSISNKSAVVHANCAGPIINHVVMEKSCCKVICGDQRSCKVMGQNKIDSIKAFAKIPKCEWNCQTYIFLWSRLLVGCFVCYGSLRQYFSLCRALSQTGGEEKW